MPPTPCTALPETTGSNYARISKKLPHSAAGTRQRRPKSAPPPMQGNQSAISVSSSPKHSPQDDEMSMRHCQTILHTSSAHFTSARLQQHHFLNKYEKQHDNTTTPSTTTHTSTSSISTHRGRIASISVGEDAHLKLIDLVTKSMSQIFEKHERFESLRYLSRLRRRLPLHLGSSGIDQFKATLNAIQSESHHQHTGYDSNDDDVFITPAQGHMSASEVASKAVASAAKSTLV